MDEKSAAAIANWVKAGGVLLIMTNNDTSNCDLRHFNMSGKFRIHFSNRAATWFRGAS